MNKIAGARISSPEEADHGWELYHLIEPLVINLPERTDRRLFIEKELKGFIPFNFVNGYEGGSVATVGRVGWKYRILAGHARCLLGFVKAAKEYLSNSNKPFVLLLEDDVVIINKDRDIITKAFNAYIDYGAYKYKSLHLGWLVPFILFYTKDRWMNITARFVNEHLFIGKGFVDNHAVIYHRDMIEQMINELPDNIEDAYHFVYHHRPYDLYYQLKGQFYSFPMSFAQNTSHSNTEGKMSTKNPSKYDEVNDLVGALGSCLMVSGKQGYMKGISNG